jgi:hypothetical protein
MYRHHGTIEYDEVTWKFSFVSFFDACDGVLRVDVV